MSDGPSPATHPLFRTDAGAGRPAPDDAEPAPARAFDRVVRLAAAALRAPMAAVALASGGPDLYTRSCHGFPATYNPSPGTPFGCPLSRHVFATGAALRVADVPNHEIGRGHAGLAALGIAAYVGVPVRTPDGGTIGMLSVFAREPREFTAADEALLADLAEVVATEVDLRASARAASAAADERRAILRETEERYRRLFEANPRPTFVYDVDTLRFLAVNRAAVEAYGWSRDEFLAMTILDIRAPEDAERVLRRLAEYADAPAAASDWRHRTRDGRWLDVSILSQPVPFGSRRARLVLVDDVTERRRLEAQLRDAQKMEAVGRLAGGIAHDFNNLLTAIKGYSQLGLVALDSLPAHDAHGAPAGAPAGQAEADDEPPLTRLRADLRAIRSAADRAAALTAQLLAFSRRQVLQPVVLDLNAVAAGMEAIVRRLIGEHIDVRIELGAQAGRVKADPSQVEQVILNLVLNARDAMPHGGRLTVETADVVVGAAEGARVGLPAGAYVVLAVRDTGVGMDEATRSRVFEPFFTTKDVGRGTGLGLATVYGIVKQSGGDVRVESAPGIGTTVLVHLPATDESAVAQRVPATTPPGGPASGRGPGEQGATVLVVEDEPSVRELARAVLRQGGYRVLVAPNAEEALRLLDGMRGPLHLLVTDVVMPGASGPELAVEVTRLHPGVAVIYMSGYSERAIEGHGALGPGTEFVEKPFTLEEFRSKVAAVMGAGHGPEQGAG
jgi:two-component system, cell cycle sensor histidine kinase and response regulator CckA